MNKSEKILLVRDYFRYVSFSVLSMLAISFYIVVDTYFIADCLGANGLAALNLAIPIFSIIQGSSLVIAIGASSKYNILLARNERKKANSVFMNSIFLALILSVIYMILGLFFSEKICVLLAANDEIFHMTNSYIKVLLIASPAFIFNYFFSAYVRNDNNPKLASVAVFSSSLSNIILDYIFMYPLKMGILGAVLATVSSSFISIMILQIHKLKRQNTYHFRKEKFHIETISEILHLGFPAFLNEFSLALVMFTYNTLILSLSGNLALAAYGIVCNVALIFVFIFNGVGQGVQPLLSNAYGKSEFEKTKYYFKLSASTVLIIGVISSILLGIFSNEIVSIFNTQADSMLQKMAEEALILYTFAFAFAGLNLLMINNFIAVEEAKKAKIISGMRAFFVIIPLAIIMSKIFGLRGLYLAYPLTDIIISLVLLYFYYKFKKAKPSK